jgi:hypothetical protein
LVLLWLGSGLALPRSHAAQPGTVFLVVGSDTAIWDGLDLTRRHCVFLPDLYTDPARNAFKVMDPAFRQRFVDSFGNPLRMTWWMLVGSLHADAENIDVPVPNLMPLHLMQRYQGAAMASFGDEVSLHYHTFFWSDYNSDGVYYWNEALTFHESRYDFDVTLAQSLLEEGVFPVTFRSGWHYMDNEWQSRLNEVLPFSLHNDSPNVHLDTTEPLENNLDWSKATTSFVPYHPSPANYQLPGNGPGWNVRSVKMPNLTQSTMNKLFAAAGGGTNQVACLWAHLPETPFLADIAKVDLYAHVASTNYPDVRFRYCTATEAMQRWTETTDHAAPALEVQEQVEGEVVTLVVTTDEPIFQPQPFVAVKDLWEQYQVVPCPATGSNQWSARLPVPRSKLAKVGVAVTDPSGNSSHRLLHHLPEDLYLDDRDPAYAETAGSWEMVPQNLAWDLGYRQAVLAPGGSAQAGWNVRVSEPGEYHLWTQMPAATNPVARTTFTLTVDGVLTQTVRFTAPAPARTWIPLFTQPLEPAQNVEVQCLFEGEPDGERTAALDVLRVTPLQSGPAFISDLEVTPSATTALVRWTTPVPATSRVDFGAQADFDRTAAPEIPSLRRHAVTLDGLAPGTPYFYRIESVSGDRIGVRYGTFATPRSLGTAVAFDLTNQWRYTSANLDGIPWASPGFGDLDWQTGQGVFWADNRAAPNAGIPSLGTRLPLDGTTGYPFVTYYFRTHFTIGSLLPGMSLVFSNYLDDGVIYYLNGAEVVRRHLPAAPAAITNGTRANGYDCSGDATCSTLSTLSAARTAGALVAGDNVLAAEVHNYSAKSPDITFGLALFLNAAVEAPPALGIEAVDGLLLVYWNGPPSSVETADAAGFPTRWTRLAESVSSPLVITNPATAFYRLRP